MKRLLLLVLCFSLFACEKQDGPDEVIVTTPEFVRAYGGTLNDVAQSVIATSDGGFAVLGYTQSNDGDIADKTDTSFDYWLLKFDSSTELEWSRSYGGSGDDRGRSIVQTQDGGFALFGYSASSDGDISMNNGFRDFWLIKTDPLGNLTWEKSYGFSGSDEGTHLIETSDNHFLLTGVLDVTSSGGQGNSGRNGARHAGGDYWALKVSQTGDLVWSRFFGGSFTDTPHGIIENPNNQFIIAGASDSDDVDISGNKGTYDYWVVKAASSGNMVWERSYGGLEIDEARGIVSAGDGNYVVVGDTRSSDQDVSQNNGAADLWIIKISDNGDILWEQSLGGTNFDVPRSINPTSDSGFIIAGSSRSSDGNVSSNQGQNDAWAVKVNNNGQLVWQRTFGGSEIDFGYDAVELIDGSVILVGESSSSNGDLSENKGFSDLLIIKINP